MTSLNDTTIEDAASRYIKAGYHIAAWAQATGKGPRTPGWDKKSVQGAKEGQNIGLIHGLSRTVILDVDDMPLTVKVFRECLGVDLAEMMETFPTYRGNPDRCKILFKVPARIELDKLAVVKLNFPDKKKGEVFSIRGAVGDKPAAAQDVLPPSIHPETGLKYQWDSQPPPFSRLRVAPPALMQIWQYWPDFQKQAEAVCGFRQPEIATPAHQQSSYTPSGESIIDLFNQQTTMREILLANGYQATRQENRYLHPGSSTGMAGTMVLTGDDGTEVVYSHGSDILGENGKASDAFGAFTILENNGDAKAAYKAAAERLGMAYSQQTHRQLPSPNSPTAPSYPPETAQKPPTPPTYNKNCADPFDMFTDLEMTEEDYQRIEDQEYFIEEFLPKGGLFMFASDSGEGKSWLSFMCANRTLAQYPETKVIFFDLDSGPKYTKKRVKIMWTRYGTKRFRFISQAKTDSRTTIPRLEDMAQRDLKNTIIVIDSLTGFTEGAINESAKIKPFLTTCEKLRNAGATVILIHHTKKAKEDDGTPIYAGSYAIKAAMDCLYMVQKTADKKQLICHLAKSRGDYVPRTFEIDSFDGMTAKDIDYVSAEDALQIATHNREKFEEEKVTAMVSIAEGKNEPLIKTSLRDKIMEKMGRSNHKANKMIARLIKAKAIYEDPSGLKNERFIRVGYKAAINYEAETPSKDPADYDDGEAPF